MLCRMARCDWKMNFVFNCRLSWSSRVSAPLISFFFAFFLISGCHESHDGYPHLEFQRRRADASNGESGQERGAQVLKFARDFTCFTGTKVQILTLRTLRTLHTATSLLVQKYIYWRLLCWYKNTNTDATEPLQCLHTGWGNQGAPASRCRHRCQ